MIKRLQLLLGLLLLLVPGIVTQAWAGYEKELDRLVDDLNDTIFCVPDTSIKTIAVGFFQESDGLRYLASRKLEHTLIARLVKTKHYQIVPLEQRDVNLRELKFGASGCTDQMTAKPLGRLATVDALLTGIYWREKDDFIVYAELLRLDTGVMIWSCTVVLSADDFQEGTLPPYYDPDGKKQLITPYVPRGWTEYEVESDRAYTKDQPRAYSSRWQCQGPIFKELPGGRIINISLWYEDGSGVKPRIDEVDRSHDARWIDTTPNGTGIRP